ncbi:MAG: hypothetical protein OXI35_00085, partial [Gemmatimonadota bacterium]|nr:hypothetical protein [Gemmatimonadota bacterium]
PIHPLVNTPFFKYGDDIQYPDTVQIDGEEWIVEEAPCLSEDHLYRELQGMMEWKPPSKIIVPG